MELILYLRGIVGICCHSHQPAYPDVREGIGWQTVQQPAAFIGAETMFGFFLCDMYFQQDTDDAVVFGRLLVDFLQ